MVDDVREEEEHRSHESAEHAAQVRGDAAQFETKLRSIAAFASQTQIGALVEQQRRGGPVEHLRKVTWSAYDPAAAGAVFASVP